MPSIFIPLARTCLDREPFQPHCLSNVALPPEQESTGRAGIKENGRALLMYFPAAESRLGNALETRETEHLQDLIARIPGFRVLEIGDEVGEKKGRKQKFARRRGVLWIRNEKLSSF
jgi:hypothetical protein